MNMKQREIKSLPVFLLLLIWKLNTYSQAAPAFLESHWIAPSYQESLEKRACPIFLKRFGLKIPSHDEAYAFRAGNKIKQAILFVTALGLYEAILNGKRIGQDYFTPGFTDYNKRLQYQQYDVTSLITSLNELRITVGEGWYRGVFRGTKHNNNYGDEAGLLVELKVVYSDGKTEKIVSDDSWGCAAGPIRYSELYDGEMFDASHVVKCWSPVKLLEHSKDILVPSESEPVRKQENFQPMKIFYTPKGEQVIDFGQNMAGWVRLNLRGKKGDTIRLFHAEVLDKMGNFYTGNLREAKAVDTYVLQGKVKETLEPHFTYHGFRYVKVEGFKATHKNMTAIALYSNLKKTGTFVCSNPLINKLQKNIEWSMNSNFVDIPTDCPQRSERLGWTGDAQVFAATASFLRDTKTFYSKWLKDLSNNQGKNGGVPNSIPIVGPYQDVVEGYSGWGDAATIVPWTMFEIYGDVNVLANQYSSMKGWVDYINHKSQGGLWLGRGYGDWLAPNGSRTDVPLINQCFWAYSTTLLINAAEILNNVDDVKRYTEMLTHIKQMFVKTYVTPDGLLTSDTQTAYILALKFNMLPIIDRQIGAARLVTLINSNQNHLATGFLGTPFILKVLSDNGYSNIAYMLLNQKSIPSWLYPVTRDATTIWETWDGINAEGNINERSFNHYSYGAVGSWLYEYVAGIRSAAPGYKKIIIKPEIGGGLTWAKGSYESAYGKIVSEWKLSGNKVTMNVEIPSGTTAEVWVPGKKMIVVGAGNYVFTGQLILKQNMNTN